MTLKNRTKKASIASGAVRAKRFGLSKNMAVLSPLVRECISCEPDRLKYELEYRLDYGSLKSLYFPRFRIKGNRKIGEPPV